MKKQIAFGLICATLLFNNGANANVDSKSPQIDQNTLENQFNDDSIGQLIIRDSSGMVIVHDDPTNDEILINELVEKTHEMMFENDSHKLTRTIISILFLTFVLISVTKRKKNK
jgi:hypothetical protein